MFLNKQMQLSLTYNAEINIVLRQYVCNCRIVCKQTHPFGYLLVCYNRG